MAWSEHGRHSVGTTIILDSVFDPFDVARVIYTELTIPGDPGFDDLDTDTRTALIGMVFDLDPEDPGVGEQSRRIRR